MIMKLLSAVPAMILAGSVSFAALAADQAPSSTPPAQVNQGAADKTADPTAAVAQAGQEYTPPPGYKTKVRKGETVYCRSRAPLGTRIKAEECFTEAQIKEVERAMATSTEDIQQRGRMCTTGMMCTGQGGG